MKFIEGFEKTAETAASKIRAIGNGGKKAVRKAWRGVKKHRRDITMTTGAAGSLGAAYGSNKKKDCP